MRASIGAVFTLESSCCASYDAALARSAKPCGTCPHAVDQRHCESTQRSQSPEEAVQCRRSTSEGPVYQCTVGLNKPPRLLMKLTIGEKQTTGTRPRFFCRQLDSHTLTDRVVGSRFHRSSLDPNEKILDLDLLTQRAAPAWDGKRGLAQLRDSCTAFLS